MIDCEELTAGGNWMFFPAVKPEYWLGGFIGMVF